MKAKRYLYLFLAVWTLIAIVCFHGFKHHDALSRKIQYSNDGYSQRNASYENVNEVLTGDDSDADPTQHPAKRPPRKILVRRVVTASNMHLPVLFAFVKGNLSINLHHTFGRTWFNKSLLPGYYNFLFRLKPF